MQGSSRQTFAVPRSPLEKTDTLTFRAQSNKDLIRTGTTNSHDFAEYFRQAYTDTPDWMVFGR
jgi:hypothetical protein